MTAVYPAEPALRDRFVVDRRGPRDANDPFRHQGCLLEDEPAPNGDLVRVATIFLTGRECPWRCVMCDLWHQTIPGDTPAGALPHQIAQAVDEIQQGHGRFPAHVKLYNAASFFDPRAVPERDYAIMAGHLARFSRVIVESHPSLIGARVDRWKDAIAPATLEVALGLETAHPEALDRLNKRMTVDDFRRAAEALGARGVGLRVFLLVNPPFVANEEQDEWLARSVDVAFAAGAGVVSLIPTRSGNGAIDALAEAHLFGQPRLADLERGLAAALSRSPGRVFADLWNLDRFTPCPSCVDARKARLARINLSQRVEPPIHCDRCGGAT